MNAVGTAKKPIGHPIKSHDERLKAALNDHDAAFEAYISKYGKSYTSEEKPKRKVNHKECLKAAQARNLRISKLTQDPEEKNRFKHGPVETHGETIFCDLTPVLGTCYGHVRDNLV